MKKVIFTITFLCVFSLIASAATFNSSGASTNWSASSSWTVVSGSDADGIPDADDNVVILNGHSISLTVTSYSYDVLIQSGGTLTTNNKYLGFRGTSFQNLGTIVNYLNINFAGASPKNFQSNQAIVSAYFVLIQNLTLNVIAGTSLSCPTGLTIGNNCTLNNSGTISCSNLNTNNTSGNIWNNLSGSSLTITNSVPYPLTLNSSSNSLVTLNKAVTSVPSWNYFNLTLVGSPSTKLVNATLNVDGNLINSTGVTLNLANNTLNLKGNLSNSGTISNISTVNLIGTTNQTLTSAQTLTIPTLSSTNTNTIILNTSTYNLSNQLTLAGSLTLNASATLNLNSNTLNLAGNLSNSGAISNLADVNFNGTTAQSISSTQSLAFTNLTSSNTAGVTFTVGNHTITNSLTVSSGNLNVGTDLVTLVSDATKTAYIANSAGTISGSMIVQRYLPSRSASYSDLSPSCSNLTIDDWDNELFMSIGAPNDVPGYPGGDGTSAGFYSVTEYNTATDWYDSVLTGTALNVGQGYGVWIADDMTSFPGRAIDSRGTPNMGSVPIAAVFDAGNPNYPGWNLIGNPHAAFIDWSAVVAASSNVDPEIQIYDGSGNYVNATNPEIAPGQGFFCYVTSNTTVNVPQSAKTTTTSSSFMRKAQIKDYDLKLRLSSNSNPFYHEIKVVYDSKATAKFEQGKDVPFIKSPRQTAPYMTFVDGNKQFIENNVNTYENTLVLPLQIKTPIAGNYVIELEGLLSNSEYTSAYVVKNSTSEKFEINDANIVNVYFEQGQISNDFSLVLSKKKSESSTSLTSLAESVSIFSTSDYINIKSNLNETQEVKIEVLNIMGQLILEKTEVLTTNTPVLVSTSELSSEVYVIKVTTKDNKQFTNKIIVTK